ncbi:MAG TPA: DUF1565 domain-containing protein, partial [Candidatus Nitrosotalea sp.]|nr:DUF1565 domain-containing protein [Candidatus Nitrosotalea sp.]
MRSCWIARLFFLAIAVLAVSGILSGTACTRWGQPGPAVPSLAPLSTLYVDAKLGSDATGNGTQAKPYKTLTKAIAVVVAAKVIAPYPPGVQINLASGDYNAANGETFPIFVPKNVTIMGANYNAGLIHGSFIDGVGEDVAFEQTVHAPAHSAYATLVGVSPAQVGLSEVYVG